MKTIVLGITGSIAAYKAAEIVRMLKKKGYNVNCVMTDGAKEFVTPLTLRTLSDNPVYDDVFYESKRPDAPVKHIGLAQNCDALLIAPATANVIGKIASGIADDLLTTVVMATDKKVFIAPAMNTKMWQNPIVRENVAKLKKLGYVFIGPAKGELACGDTGEGHIECVENIVRAVTGGKSEDSKKKTLNGKRVLITSGATREKIDDVRFISNPSSGKSGYFLAKEALKLGADVIFITGKSNYIPDNCKIIETESASDMLKAVKANYKKADIVIGAAAVGDFKPINRKTPGKIPRKDKLTLEFEPTTDIIAEVGKDKGKIVLVGYSAESGDSLIKTKSKIKTKNLDYIVFNDITKKNSGFESDMNSIRILDKTGKTVFKGMDSKEKLAEVIFDILMRRV